ncbi:hypothetical protein, conserved [Babesia ovata]|uniref:Extracellular matrix-binding ebh n=1 Tax=Babesia ovata TaxID=189622 RepID=A0A2H6KJG2_9APIC|nr:uncharacterized protein BOVATA_046140 [Babesia ovata]GBE63121.1 hypothetical protein, conserved [Babesia ovata]
MYVSDILSEYDKHLNEKTNAVNTSLSTLSDHLGNKYVADVNSKISEPLEKQLTAWRDTVESLETEVNNIEQQKINVLDNALKSSVLREFLPVKSVVEHMRKVSVSGSVFDDAKHVDGQLVAQKRAIINQINSLRDVKDKHFTTIYSRLKDAMRFLEKDFDRNYKNIIIAMFEDIKREVTIVHDNLLADKGKLEMLIRDAWREFATVKTNIQEDGDSIVKKWSGLKGHIRGLIGDMVYNVKHTSKAIGTLQKIVEGFEDYAGEFAKVNFATKVEKWIKTIVEKEPVKGWMQTYFKQEYKTSDFNKFYSDRTADFAGIFRQKLDEDIKVAQAKINEVKGDKQYKIEKNIDAVKDGIDTFLKQFEAKLVSKKLDELVSGIVEEIEKAPKLKLSDPPSPSPSSLLNAVVITLASLSATARQVYEEFHSFTTNSQITNVTKAMTKIGEIENEFGDGLNNKGKFGGLIDAALANVAAPIEKLTTLLDQNDKEGSIKYKLGDKVNGLQKTITELDDIRNEKSTKNNEDGKIEKQRNEAARLMDELKAEIKGRIQEVQAKVEDADKALKEAINTLVTDVNKAFQNLTNDVQLFYAHSHKADLQALRELLQERKNAIDSIIDTDKKTGLKGFLSILLDKHNGGRKLHDLKGHKNVESLSPKLKDYLYDIFQYVFVDLPKHLPNSQYPSQLSTIHTALSTLLSHLRDQKHFDHRVPGMLQNLTTSVQALHSTGFANPAYPVLDAFPKSLVKFVEQLEKGYVNRYEGHEEILLYNYVSKKVTPEGEKCAKVFLTLLEILNSHLRNLYDKCIDGKDCKDKCIRMYDNEKNKRTANPLGDWFQRRGFKVSDDNKTQNGS